MTNEKCLHNFILKFTLYGVRWNLFVVAHDWASAKAQAPKYATNISAEMVP